MITARRVCMSKVRSERALRRRWFTIFALFRKRSNDHTKSGDVLYYIFQCVCKQQHPSLSLSRSHTHTLGVEKVVCAAGSLPTNSVAKENKNALSPSESAAATQPWRGRRGGGAFPSHPRVRAPAAVAPARLYSLFHPAWTGRPTNRLTRFLYAPPHFLRVNLPLIIGCVIFPRRPNAIDTK